MYCSECGCKAGGKFCSACGTRIATGGVLPPETVPLPLDWSEMIDYQALLQVAEVRDRIARAAAQAKKRLSGEEFLETYGNVLSKLAGLPVSLPMASLAQFAQNTYAKLGVKTGKSREELVPQPPGTILVSLICSLARAGREIRSVQQLTDGCILIAALPSDLLALEGDLILAVGRREGGTVVTATTEIPGQWFDWGKSSRCLAAIFAELRTSLAA